MLSDNHFANFANSPESDARMLLVISHGCMIFATHSA
jgi:hypothetical protein